MHAYIHTYIHTYLFTFLWGGGGPGCYPGFGNRGSKLRFFEI